MRAAFLAFLVSAAAVGQESTPVSAEQAKSAVPRADLSGLNDQQRGTFLEVAKEVFNYAGCQDTLAKCLAANVKDPHAVRMAELVRQLVLGGYPAQVVIKGVEEYYLSFDPRNRQQLAANNCATLGSGPVNIVEFSDYQCPHCAHAVEPLHDLVTKEAKGKARLCSKYFPLPSHPRARIAAACAEYAREHGRFWELNALLFSHQEALEDANLKDYAKQVGLNGDEMLQQAYAGKFDAVIEKHIREGTAAGLESTPTLFLNGRQLVLPPTPFFLKYAVEDELEWSKKHAFTFDKARRT